MSEVCWVSDDSDVSLLVLVVFTIESDDVFLCLAVIMPQITKMIITQYMNKMRIFLLEKRDILIPRIMLSINISLYILKNYCFLLLVSRRTAFCCRQAACGTGARAAS